MFKGSITALVTPFKNGKVDEATFTRFIDWQIAEGTNGLVPVGTTGESPTSTTRNTKRHRTDREGREKARSRYRRYRVELDG